ncbi:MAG TPA: hypothetical protein VMS17_26630 [Gemmataceae bacterium]|nr:hypothetical protein [Gemmataceae bacterium]
MKRILAASLALPLLLVVCAPARADIAPPPLPMGAKTKFVVVVDDRADTPHLQIPKSLLQGGQSGGKEDAGLFGAPTIIAGLALTAAFVSGGFWLIRRGRGPGRTLAAVVVILSFVALGASAVLADIPRPPRPRGPVALPLPANVTLPDTVVVDFLDKGDAITLIVNKKAVPDPKPGSPAPADK